MSLIVLLGRARRAVSVSYSLVVQWIEKFLGVRRVDRTKVMREMEAALDVVLRADRVLKDAVPYNGAPNLTKATQACQDITDNIDRIRRGWKLMGFSRKKMVVLNCCRLIKEMLPELMDALNDRDNYESEVGGEFKKHKGYGVIKYRHEIDKAVYHLQDYEKYRPHFIANA